MREVTIRQDVMSYSFLRASLIKVSLYCKNFQLTLNFHTTLFLFLNSVYGKLFLPVDREAQ